MVLRDNVFGSPILYRERRNHEKDCYFCVKNTVGYNTKKKVDKYISKDLQSYYLLEDDNESDIEVKSISSNFNFDQAELNDLVRDLQL